MGFKVYGMMKDFQVVSGRKALEGLKLEASKHGTDLVRDAAAKGINFDADLSNDKVLYFRAKMLGYDLPNGNGDAISRVYAADFGPSFIGKHLDLNHETDLQNIIGKVVSTFHVEAALPLVDAQGRVVGSVMELQERIIGLNALADDDSDATRELQLEGICRIDRNTELGELVAQKLIAGTIDGVSQEASTDYATCSVCGHKIGSPMDKVCAHLENGSLMIRSYQVEGKKNKVLAFKNHANPVGTGLAVVPVPAYDRGRVQQMQEQVRAGKLSMTAALLDLKVQALLNQKPEHIMEAIAALENGTFTAALDSALTKLNGHETLALMEKFKGTPVKAGATCSICKEPLADPSEDAMKAHIQEKHSQTLGDEARGEQAARAQGVVAAPRVTPDDLGGGTGEVVDKLRSFDAENPVPGKGPRYTWVFTWNDKSRGATRGEWSESREGAQVALDHFIRTGIINKRDGSTYHLEAAPGFNNWLDTFISEKGIDLEETFDVEGPSGTNVIPYGVIVEHMKKSNAAEQAKLKNAIVYIDFKNGDVRHFFRHLGQAIAAGKAPEANLLAEWKGWETATGVEVVSKAGVEEFATLEEAKAKYPTLDPVQGSSEFTWAMKGSDGKMRFEDWGTNELLSASLKASSDDIENAREAYARKKLGKKLEGMDDEAEDQAIQDFIDENEEEVDAYVRRTVKAGLVKAKLMEVLAVWGQPLGLGAESALLAYEQSPAIKAEVDALMAAEKTVELPRTHVKEDMEEEGAIIKSAEAAKKAAEAMKAEDKAALKADMSDLAIKEVEEGRKAAENTILDAEKAKAALQRYGLSEQASEAIWEAEAAAQRAKERFAEGRQLSDAVLGAMFFRKPSLLASYWTITAADGTVVLRVTLGALSGGRLERSLVLAGKTINLSDHLTTTWGADLVAESQKRGAEAVLAELEAAQAAWELKAEPSEPYIVETINGQDIWHDPANTEGNAYWVDKEGHEELSFKTLEQAQAYLNTGKDPLRASGEMFQEVTGDEPYKVVDLDTGGESYHTDKKDAYKMAWVIKTKLGHNYRIEVRKPSTPDSAEELLEHPGVSHPIPGASLKADLLDEVEQLRQAYLAARDAREADPDNAELEQAYLAAQSAYRSAKAANEKDFFDNFNKMSREARAQFDEAALGPKVKAGMKFTDLPLTVKAGETIESLTQKIDRLKKRRENMNDKESPPGRADFEKKHQRIAKLTEEIDSLWNKRAALIKEARAVTKASLAVKAGEEAVVEDDIDELFRGDIVEINYRPNKVDRENGSTPYQGQAEVTSKKQARYSDDIEYAFKIISPGDPDDGEDDVMFGIGDVVKLITPSPRRGKERKLTLPDIQPFSKLDDEARMDQLEALGLQNWEVVDDYSGRGMHGETSPFAFTVEHTSDAQDRKLTESGLRRDSLGRKTIYYLQAGVAKKSVKAPSPKDNAEPKTPDPAVHPQGGSNQAK